MNTVAVAIMIIVGLVLAIAGVVGCLLPMMPGPPLGFIALLIISFARNWEPFSTTFLVVVGAVTALTLLLDYVLPVMGARKYGASRLGFWGSMFGVLVGMFVFPPFGMIIGGFAGAVAGELCAGSAGRSALRAGWGVFAGNLLGIALKTGLSVIMLFLCVTALFR